MSLGNCVFTKSTTLTAWRLLAPPRDTLRSRQYSTPKSAPQPGRYIRRNLALSQQIWRLGRLELQPDDSIIAAPDDDIGAITATTKPIAPQEWDLLHGICGWANIVVWRDTLYDVDIWDDPSMARCKKSDQPITRKVASEYRSQRHKIAKALELTRDVDEGLRKMQWRHSINMLIANTKSKEESDLTRAALVKRYRGRQGRREHRFTQIHAARIPRPYTWSSASFYEHVAALVTSSVTGSLHGQLYNADDSHILSVGRILHELFEDPQLDAYLSIPACNLAMSFFYKISQFSEARSILSRMEDRNLLKSSETFNILLKGSAKRKDITHFEYILKQMIERGLQPNAQTWISFFQITETELAKSEVYQNMRNKGVLSNFFGMKNFLKFTAREVLVKYLQKGHSLTSILDYFGGLEGIPWQSPEVGNMILDEIGNHSPVEDVIRLLKQLEQHNMIFDEVTLNTILHHCLSNRDHDEAIWAVRWFRKRHSLRPGRLAYDALFRQAWRSRLLNCSKVIWRYACSEGFVTYRMKRSVSISLLRDFPTEPAAESMTRGDMWRAAAGKLVVGVSPNTNAEPETHRTPSLTGLVAMEESAAPAPSNNKERKRNLWTERFAQDLALAHRLHIKYYLDVLLRRALAMDRQWALQEVPRRKPFNWILQHSIQVELKENFSARYLEMRCLGQDDGRYLVEQHPSKSQGQENPMVEHMHLEVSDTSKPPEPEQEGLVS